jgi:AraC-like DNA-binding protein
MLAFVKQGSSRHWVDMMPYTLKADTFYFSVPHQIHVKEQAKPLIGIMLCFTDEFLAIEENQLLKQLPVIQNPYNGHELELGAEDVCFIEDVLLKMLTEFKQKRDWRNGMLLAYLRVLLIYISRLYTEQFTNEELLEDRMLLKKFRVLIEEQYIQLHDVAAYARLLYISAGHLSEVVKQQSGKTAIEHIHERLMLEAQRLLFHTESSIKEIAFKLGFEDASYFNRFFKRLSSQTPLAYRNITRKMYR